MDSESDLESVSSDRPSSSSSSSSDEENGTGLIIPYNFEPRFEEHELQDIDEEAQGEDVDMMAARLDNLEWCSCEHCQIMGSGEECICCKECENTSAKLEDNVNLFNYDAPFSCITNHPGFKSVALDPWVLEVAWLSYKQHYDKKVIYNGPKNKKYRHISYRQYARWIHGYVGKNIRIVLPSCVVSCIRAHFPPPGDDPVFTGFKLPDLN
ncbi:uncharacterized protein [Antedon mediterranea]|uniref:uncharacterized protein n=1 Tax=Antedon mediterranea TaxID=105859 RepID=UPI003AF4B587